MKKILISIKLILLITILSQSSFASQPHCKIDVNQVKNNHTIQEIKIKVFKFKKFQKNNIKILIGNSKIISPKLKKRFKAKIIVKFNDNKLCEFLGTVRQNGDLKDHIKLKENSVVQSLDVKLTTGNINGIVKFKLFLEGTRGNSKEEIIFAEILRSFNYLVPRTSLVSVDNNGIKSEMLFQEKVSKEFLEFNNRREGPILEGDEKYMMSFMSKIPSGQTSAHIQVGKALERGTQIQLAKQTNSNWAMKGFNHLQISLNALTKLNKIYLLYLSSYNNEINKKLFINYSLNNNLLSLGNKDKERELDLYNLLIFSAGAQHSLYTHNRKFYWNSLENYFEPIYYDGGMSLLDPFTDYWSPYNEDIPNTLDLLIKNLRKIDKKLLNQKIKINRVNINEKRLSKIIDQLINNANKLKLIVNEKKQEQVNYNYNLKLTNNMWNNYFASVKENGQNIKYIFTKNSQNKKISNKKFYLLEPCNKNLNDCITEDLKNFDLNNKKYLKDLIESKLNIENYDYQFIGVNFNTELINESKLRFKNVRLSNTHFYFEDGIEIEMKDKILNIYQNKKGSRSFFKGGSLKNIKINYYGFKDDNSKKEPINYPIDLKNLTGCLSLINMNLENVEFFAINSTCEDSINMINVHGVIDDVHIVNSFSDGLDLDFSKLEIKNLNINSAKNDCLDVSSGKYEFGNINFSQCGDKGFSVGEKSNAKVNNLIIKDSSIGVASKDSSTTNINNAKIYDSKICLSAYNKKQEFAGGTLIVNNFQCNNYEYKFNQDLFSKIIVIKE
tara:strand:- start:840 stop:3185 length:2346 start_codon:yes stop_codon:yes gene_type:complete